MTTAEAISELKSFMREEFSYVKSSISGVREDVSDLKIDVALLNDRGYTDPEHARAIAREEIEFMSCKKAAAAPEHKPLISSDTKKILIQVGVGIAALATGVLSGKIVF